MRRGGLIATACAMVAGCDLYFGPPDHGSVHRDGGAGGSDALPGPDATPALPDAMPSSFTFATCVGSTLYRSAPQSIDVAPAPIADAFAQCDGSCIAPAAVYDCQGDPGCAGAAQWLCNPAPCLVDGSSCSTTDTRTCSATAGCALEVETEACTCVNDAWACSAPCNDGLCTPVDVLHAIAGRWHGTVTPPSFAAPYTVTLSIAPDGHLWTGDNSNGPRASAFYYGDDGGDPHRWFQILGETPTGAVGQVGVMFSHDEILPGMITGLHVDATHLSFHFWDAWLGCSREFIFDLERAP